MLILNIPETEWFNDSTQEFCTFGPWKLELEHSLLSVSKWEAKYKKSFLENKTPSVEESNYYIWCMLLSPELPEASIMFLTNEDRKAIYEYIGDSNTATTIHHEEKTTRKEVVTSELVYYWMVSLNIPFEAERWNFNRLMMLIRICNVKNGKPKKRPTKEIAAEYHALNERRKEMLGTTG